MTRWQRLLGNGVELDETARNSTNTQFIVSVGTPDYFQRFIAAKGWRVFGVYSSLNARHLLFGKVAIAPLSLWQQTNIYQ